MTGEEFTARYRLKQQLAEGEIASFVASDARRQSVHVHVFRGEDAPAFDPASLRPGAREKVREILDVEGLTVVVTEPLEPFSTFEAWITGHQGDDEDQPGTYTRIFGTVSLPGDSGGPEEAEEPGDSEVDEDETAAPPPTPAGPEPEPLPDDAGEYTRLFGAPKVPEPSAPEPSVPEPSVPEPSVPEPSVPEPSVPEPSVPEVPDEKAAEPPPVPEPAVPPPEEEPEPEPPTFERDPPDAPGPYTLVMGRPAIGPKDPGGEPRPRRDPDPHGDEFGFSDSYLDRLRGGSSESADDEGTPPPPPPPPPGRPGVPRVPEGPSEYTRIIRGVGSSGGPGPGGSGPGSGSPPPPPPPEPSAPAPRASKTPIVIGLVLTGATLVAILIYFLLLPGE